MEGIEAADAVRGRPFGRSNLVIWLGIRRAGGDEHERRESYGSEIKTHRLNFIGCLALSLEAEVRPHSRLHLLGCPEGHPHEIHFHFLDARQRFDFLLGVGHQLRT